MFLELLAMASQAGQRLFSSVPYTGTGTPQALATGIDATASSVAVMLKGITPEDSDIPVFDNVRGFTKRVRTSTVNEDTFSAVTASGKDRVLTGANYNTPGQSYTAWNFAARPKFLDIVTFSGGAGSLAHGLTETPAAALVFRRTGSGGYARMLWLAGDSVFFGNGLKITGTPFTVDAATFTPDGTLFPGGSTYVVFFFGTGSSNLAVGSYVGTVDADTDGTQIVTLPFAPAFMLLWGPPFGSVLTSWGIRVLDVRIPASLDALAGLTFADGGGGLAGSLDGATFTATSVQDVESACLTGETYRYLVIR